MVQPGPCAQHGAASSLLADAADWQRVFFIVVGVMVVVPITFVCLARQVEPLERLVGALIVAVGSGNLTDRISSGTVTDILDLHWRGLHWPTLNLADVFIVLAASASILMALRPSKTTSGSTSWTGHEPCCCWPG